MATRLRFQEKPCLNGHHLIHPLVSHSLEGRPFCPIISCIAQFPLELFEAAMMTLINHPEYNSSLILRSDIISDDDLTHLPGSLPVGIPDLRGHSVIRNIRRRLLPRRPGRDNPLDQDCTFYLSHDSEASHPSVIMLTPRILKNEQLPYYHPAVSQLAFRYVSSSGYGLDDVPPANHLIIEVIPLDDKAIDTSSRLYRTCLALLETLDRYGWGALTNYRKRVHHDVLIPRNEYQDLYLVMKERHKSLVGKWQESTDPLKHVYEDVGIATFLMLLWKHTYSNSSNSDSESLHVANVDSESRPWDDWARPPGGFVDVGCGNGILTHILLSEGYTGKGFDLRRRTSWSHYPETTQNHLHVQPFNPFEPHPHLHSGVFLIGNHADELTPWIPVISTLISASGYLSIPCCPWDFDTRFERGSVGAYPIPQYDLKSTEHEDFLETLGLGNEGQGATSYSKYRIWLGHLSSACGWKVECEMLRIPSTRNWAIIGREKINQDDGQRTSNSILSAVLERGIFKSRVPEGKSH
ncbi:DUF1613 domain-containing protein [Hysterangium stoloniferum]|nr:DUF1613 domain-containing protein [Hysterangium stoloniferum]